MQDPVSKENIGTLKGDALLQSIQKSEGHGCINPDLVWAVIFLGQFLAMAIISGIEAGRVNWDHASSIISGSGILQKLLGIIFGTCGIAMVLAFCFRYALVCLEGMIVPVSLVIFNVVEALIIVVLVSQLGWEAMQYLVIFTCIIVGFFDIYAFLKRDQIPFAEEVLKTSNRLLVHNNLLLLIAFFITFLQVFTSILWYMGIISILVSSNGDTFVVFLVLISFYWTKNCYYSLLHFIVASVTALWCYSPDKGSPLLNACGRTFTTSFGTVCFGSLVASGIMISQQFVRYTCCGDCNPCVLFIINILDELIKIYNMYALAFSAIFGWTYCESVAGIKNLMTEGSALQAISNEVITRIPLMAGGLVCSLGASLCGSALTMEYIVTGSSSFIWYLVFWVIYYLMVAGIVEVALSVSHSAIITVYLCWNQDPALFNNSHPEEYAAMHEKSTCGSILSEDQQAYMSINRQVAN